MSGSIDSYKARLQILAQLEVRLKRQMGPNALRKAREIQHTSQIRTLSTGFPDLDLLLAGGIPTGQITELVSFDTAGITTIAMQILAMGQKAHGVGVYLELTPAFHADYAARCGVDVDNLLLARPQTRDDVFDLAGELVQRAGLTVLIIDLTLDMLNKGVRQKSIPSTVPRFASLVQASTCAVVCLSHVISKQPLVTPVYKVASVRILLEHLRWIKQSGLVRGHMTKASLIRSKSGLPPKEATLAIHYPKRHE